MRKIEVEFRHGSDQDEALKSFVEFTQALNPEEVMALLTALSYTVGSDLDDSAYQDYLSADVVSLTFDMQNAFIGPQPEGK